MGFHTKMMTHLFFFVNFFEVLIPSIVSQFCFFEKKYLYIYNSIFNLYILVFNGII